MKIQVTSWGNIPRKYDKFLRLNKTNNLIEKRNGTKYFTEEEIQIAKKHVKTWTTSLLNKGIQTKSQDTIVHLADQQT